MSGQRLPATLLLYWDYDGEIGGERSLSGTQGAGELGFSGTARILDLLDERNLVGTFACVGYLALEGPLPYHARAQVSEIHTRGHEVASHAWTHEYLPALPARALREVLSRSKQALEDAIGAQVVSFVPPWNAPHRFFSRLSLGLGQFRRAWRQPTDLPALCRALRETGYRTCRVAYEPLPFALWRRLTGRDRLSRPLAPVGIEGVRCFRCTGAGGFDEEPRRVLERAASQGGLAVTWAHPHSLHNGSPQDERYLVPFLDRARELRDEGNLVVTVPSKLAAGGPAGDTLP
ncbi:MAG: polysaccharide deacetylase family protein [Planctomycetes bacterium]|nr:polysaccharide deacetylase family protein [Planctomycetota bacterium]